MIQQFLEGKLLAEFKTASDAAKECGIDLGSIHKVLREERKTAGGFEWKDIPAYWGNVQNHCR